MKLSVLLASFSSPVAGSVVYFANGGAIAGSLRRIPGADSLLAGLLAKNLERASQA